MSPRNRHLPCRAGICGGLHGIQRAKVRCASTSISPLLLQFYGLELHHLTPSGILHIAAFGTLCEAYMGIELHFKRWNDFFHARLLQGSGTEATILGGTDIYVRSGNRVDTYYRLPMFGSLNGWRKVLFDLGIESIPTTTFPCPDLWMDGAKYGSF
jgi:hypothetical protein